MKEEESRKAFEEWFEADSMPLEHSNWFRRDSEGHYEHDHVLSSFEAWEAALRFSEQQKTRL